MANLLLGQVVKELKLTSEEELGRAMRFAQDTGSPLGQALIAQEILSPTMLKACVQAQWMMRDDLLSIDECREAVALVQRSKWSFADALTTLGFYGDDSKRMRLGELLKDAGLLAPELIEEALEKANSSGLPLGKAIVSFDFLEQSTVDKLLEIQQRMRSGKVAYSDGLKEAASLKVSSQALSKTSRILTRLLIDGNFVTVDEVQSYHTAAVTTGRSLVDLLSLYSNVDARQLFVLSSIARRIEAGGITYKDGMALTEKFRSDFAGIDCKPLESYENGKISLYMYLRLFDYLNAARVQKLIEYLSSNQSLVDKMLRQFLCSDSVTAADADKQIEKASAKVKIRMCIESDELLAESLQAAFPADEKNISRARYMLQLVNSNCLKLEESLVWATSEK
jgi:hypothetical protein